jgi:hypothetical protein
MLTDVKAAYEELALREIGPVDDDQLRHLSASTKSYLEVIADELWLRAESALSATAESSSL